MRRILAVMADTHAGHKFGLCNPDVILFDETPEGDLEPYQPNLTASQEHLWEINMQAVERAAEFAGDDPITLVHLGDPTHGNKHPEQLMSNRLADQLLIAEANLLPWLRIPQMQKVRLTIGTGAHEFGEGSATMMIATDAQKSFPELSVRAVYHGLADIDGVVIDYSHHGPGAGLRSWLHGNNVRFYLRDLMMREIMAGNQPPDLVLRGHVHTRSFERMTIEAGDSCYESSILVMPSMCMMSDFARQVTRSTYSITNGIALFEIVDGRLSAPEWIARTVDIRTKEVL